MGRTIALIVLLVVTLSSGMGTIIARSNGDTGIMQVLGVISAVSLLALGILAMINGQRSKAPRRYQSTGIQKLPKR